MNSWQYRGNFLLIPEKNEQIGSNECEGKHQDGADPFVSVDGVGRGHLVWFR